MVQKFSAYVSKIGCAAFLVALCASACAKDAPGTGPVTDPGDTDPNDDQDVDPVTGDGDGDPPVTGDGDQPSTGDGDQGDGDGDGDWGDGDGDGDGDGAVPPPPEVDPSTLNWQQANLTEFESYPEEGSSECEDFSGCDYEGRFAGLDGKQSEEWVMMNNIAAVHSKDWGDYERKTLRLRSGGNEIDVVVYDMCSDNDCDGCCTQNSSETGFLIDLEISTFNRFDADENVIEWACLDCN